MRHSKTCNTNTLSRVICQIGLHKKKAFFLFRLPPTNLFSWIEPGAQHLDHSNRLQEIVFMLWKIYFLIFYIKK